jgi:hypothetical protein
MFHMSNDSGLFRTREQLEKDGWKLRGNVFERGAEKYLPLYEAKMVSPFDHRTASVVKSLTAVDRQNQAAAIDEGSKADPAMAAMPLYWVPLSIVVERSGTGVHWLAGWRNVTSPTNERTALASMFPIAGVGHSEPLLRAGTGALETAWVVAALSSFACDFFVRQKLGGVNFTFGVMQQIVIPRVESLMADRSLLIRVAHCRIMELSATADDMSPFSRDLWPEGDGAVFRYDPERRFEIRCELDAAFFHLYLGTADDWRAKASPELLKALPTPRDAVAYIMETFPIVKRKDLATHGVYRTKERIIALYDQLQLCLATNTPFVSTLTPPPGPPTNADGTFAKLPPWPKGVPKPAAWPGHIHSPLAHRT